MSFVLSPTLPAFAQSDTQSSSTVTNNQSSSLADASTTVIDVTTSTASSSDLSLSSSTVATTSLNTDSSSTEVITTESTSSVSSTQDMSQVVSSTPVLNVSSTDASSSVSVASTTIPETQPLTLTKFKKDPSLSEDAELAAVKQHLIDSGIPQDIIDRVDAYKTAEQTAAAQPQQPGLLTQITNLFTGSNGNPQLPSLDAEASANPHPFKVGVYSGSINTASADSYNQTFSNNQEQSGGLLQKMQNFLNAGTLQNLNFDDTKSTTPLSWVFGQKALAVDDNPNDYLAAGNEIVFSQAIKNEANSLNNNPLAILNFIHNNITYVPYYGSKKGSAGTLTEGAGNDTDQASLLIAMLRYSGIPARYRQVDAQMDIQTVINLLGVHSATAAAQVLSLEQIPYILYTDSNNNPLFFVIEHTYVEAYIPYGYSRGANINDGGDSQWVPMDPSINAYYYEQPVDAVSEMDANGFQIQNFFNSYLNAGSSTQEPLDAFKAQVTATLASSTPSSTYANALVTSYSGSQTLDFIPGSLPYTIAADLDTYNYVPTSLRHTITFNVENNVSSTVLNYTAYVSDLADQELLMTYTPATPADQATLNTFATIYDVVPLSLVAVDSAIEINGAIVASSTASTTLGQAQSYTMQFNVPTRTIGGSITSNVAATVNRSVITGNTDAIALDTDRVSPPELEPSQDASTTSFVANHVLYQAASDFLYRLQANQGELAQITGGDFTNVATRATIFNDISITYATSGAPYSFSWKGLRIDSSSKINYFNRFNDDTTTHFKEFTGVFGLQASQEESDIFQNNFGVVSVATVNGLKLVSSSTFPGITLHIINSANESDIDTLTSISTSTRTLFHTAVEAGDTIYTPSAPVTYGTWQGLFYIDINFNNGTAAYTIGEGLNGGYSVCNLPGVGGSLCNWTTSFFDLLTPEAQASGITATVTASSTSITVSQTTNVIIQYTWDAITWIKDFIFAPLLPGIYKIIPQYYTSASTTITVTPAVAIGSIYNNYDTLISQYETEFGIPTGVLKAVITQEDASKANDKFYPNQYRYEPVVDYNNFSGPSPLYSLTSTQPYKHFAIGGHTASGTAITQGDQVAGLSPSYLQIVQDTDHDGWALRGLKGYTGNETFGQLLALDTPPGSQNWPIPTSTNFTAQVLDSASYGLGQVLYISALTIAPNPNGSLWFDTSTSGPATDIYEMDDPATAIHLAASVLAYKYNNLTDIPGDSGKCDGWGRAVRGYDGSAYRDIVCNIYKDDYEQ